MPLRMSARLLASAGALALAASLSSCGFNYATDRVYDVAAGTTNREGSVDVLSAVIVSAQPGSGTLITSFSNNNVSQGAKVTGIAPGGQSSVQVESFQPIKVPGGGLVNLADSGGITIKAPNLQAGDIETLKFSFGDGSSEDVDIPVVWACNEWQGLDTSASSSSASASASSSTSSSASVSQSASSSRSTSGSKSSSPTSSPSPTETSQPPAASSSTTSSSSSASSSECAVPSSSAFPETSASE